MEKMTPVYDEANDQHAVWSEPLKCFVHSIHYEPSVRTGFISMLTGNCSSMSGAVAMFESIDPGVLQVITCYPNRVEPDTCYRRMAADKPWKALKSPDPRPLREDSPLH